MKRRFYFWIDSTTISKVLFPPGGKVEFPESIVESAIREVKEETGLEVRNLIYKGLYEYVNPVAKDRYMIFNYITKDFEGELLKDAPEGKAVWVDIESAYKLPMQPSIRRRFPLFFKMEHLRFKLNGTTKKIKKGKLLYVTPKTCYWTDRGQSFNRAVAFQ